MKNDSHIQNEKMVINNNLVFPEEAGNNIIQFSNPNENLFHNSTNLNEKDFQQNINENNNDLKCLLNTDCFNNMNCNAINDSNTKYDSFDIVYLLKQKHMMIK